MVKNGCGHSSDRTLKLTVSEAWSVGITEFFLHDNTDSQKLKAYQNFLGGHGQVLLWPASSWDSKINCISEMNWWNKLVFCMLVQIQER